MYRTTAQRMPPAQRRSVPGLLVSVVLAAALAGCAPGPTVPTPTGPKQSSIPASTLAASAPTAASTTEPIGQLPGPRRPRGVYAEQHIELVVAAQQKAKPSITTDELRTFLKKRYTNLLGNPAISGLVIGMRWSTLNPNPASSGQPYDWSYLDDAFSTVAAWNAANPSTAAKTIQLQISAGFAAPKWLLDEIPSCDGLFKSPTQPPPADCGKATFQGFVEAGGGVLPMPWNSAYKGAFETFLGAIAARYGDNPLLLAVDVAGPTAASSEMILPNNINTPNQAQFGGMPPNEMWLRLLAFAFPGRPQYQDSDQAFVDEWDAAIDLFGSTFHGLTLMVWTGDGLPSFATTGFTIPSAFAADCPIATMDCAAETTILAHYVDPAFGGANAKAIGEAGMDGRTGSVGNLGAYAARLLAESTAGLSSPSAQVLGGEQFDTSTARLTLREGCTSRWPPGPNKGATGDVAAASLPIKDIPQACLAPGITHADLAGYNVAGDVPAADLISPEQAMYNVLRVFFDGTPAATAFGGAAGTGRYNFVQIYDEDFIYAAAHANKPAKVVQTDGTTITVTTQALLVLANEKVLQMSEP
jgi:hypothetical protein